MIPKDQECLQWDLAASEEELRDRLSRFVKAEGLKRGKMTYADLAERLKQHGLSEKIHETTIKAKLKRGTFAATFLVATLAALEMEGVRLEDL